MPATCAQTITTAYRTDWNAAPAGAPDCIQWESHGDDLAAARRRARSMSRRYGAAYVIRTTDGEDDGQIVYTNGEADSREWETN